MWCKGPHSSELAGTPMGYGTTQPACDLPGRKPGTGFELLILSAMPAMSFPYEQCRPYSAM